MNGLENCLISYKKSRFTAGPHIAERALSAGKGRLKSPHVSFVSCCFLQSYSLEPCHSVISAIPVEAGFMGIVTLQDVLESVLQERIYDEEDIAQRHLASAGMSLTKDVVAF